MKIGKDEGKTMDPLFPRLHIDDANKGGPRPPPRNKMAGQYDVPSTSSKLFTSGMCPISSTSGRGSFVPQSSTINVGSSRQKIFPAFRNLSAPLHMGEGCHSYSNTISGKMPTSNCKLSQPVNNRVSTNITTKFINCNSSQPCSFPTSNITRAGDENIYRKPPFLQLHLDKEKYFFDREQNICAFKERRDADIHSLGNIFQTGYKHGDKRQLVSQIRNNKVSNGDKHQLVSQLGEVSKDADPHFESVEHQEQSRPSEKNKSNADAAPHFQSVEHQEQSRPSEKYKSNVDAAPHFQSVEHQEQSRPLEKNKSNVEDTCRMPGSISRKRCYSAINDMPLSYPLLEDNRKIKNEAIMENSTKEKLDDIRLPKDENGNHETSESASIPGLTLTPDDVVGVIGHRLFCKARKMIVHQQHLFAVQVFELHRLVEVQTLLVGSLESQKNKSNLKKPYIKFPPIDELLYVTPLDQSSPVVSKPKSGTLKPNTDLDPYKDSKCKQPPLPISNIERAYTSQQSGPKPVIFHSGPAANQWLVPVKSPSEGLIYKPYTGQCPPALSVMASIYGNCGPIRVSTAGPTSYGIPAPNQTGVGRFPGSSLSQSYFQPYAVPLLNSSCPSVEIEQSSGVVSECTENKTSPPEKLPGEELSLFPTTPSVEVQKDQEKEQTVQVIKVVPHCLSKESSARILQSIQEGRKAT